LTDDSSFGQEESETPVLLENYHILPQTKDAFATITCIYIYIALLHKPFIFYIDFQIVKCLKYPKIRHRSKTQITETFGMASDDCT